MNWTPIYKKYRGLWVALKDDEKTVVGSGRTAKSALSRAKKRGFSNAILTKVPSKLVPFVGSL